VPADNGETGQLCSVEDVKIDGFTNAIYVSPQVKVLASGYFRVNDTERICVWAQTSLGWFLNTHLPIRGGGAARVAGVKKILKFIEETILDGDWWLTGDWNIFADCEYTEKIIELLEVTRLHVATKGMKTFNGWPYEPAQFIGESATSSPLDVIASPLVPRSVKVVKNKMEAGVCASDHYAIIAEY
jgi:hypothetical protein